MISEIIRVKYKGKIYDAQFFDECARLYHPGNGEFYKEVEKSELGII